MKLACPACVQTAATVTDHLEELGSVGTGRHSHPIPTPMAGFVPGLLVAAAWLLPGTGDGGARGPLLILALTTAIAGTAEQHSPCLPGHRQAPSSVL